MIVCTEPLPKDRVPTMVARWWSCRAPATISEADAEPCLISTTSFCPSVMSQGLRVGPLDLLEVSALGDHDGALVEEGI